ncbi:MAG: hypothetical protein ACJ75H_01075 [Thermoanaerobaculia bacterium]
MADVSVRTGVLSLVGGKVYGIITFVVGDGRIQGFYIMVNPDKMRHAEV